MDFKRFQTVVVGVTLLAGAFFVLPWFGPARSDEINSHAAVGNGVPPTYWDRTNPLPLDQDTLREGSRVYVAYCAHCHGATGEGDGFDAKRLDPRPAVLRLTVNAGNASDPFLYWTIFEGGKKLGTQMPQFGYVLRENEIWAVIHHLRSRFTSEMANHN